MNASIIIPEIILRATNLIIIKNDKSVKNRPQNSVSLFGLAYRKNGSEIPPPNLKPKLTEFKKHPK